MGFIYMLTSPSNKSYIGQTTRTIEERFKGHQKSGNGCVAISRAIQKHGWDNFEKHWYEVPDEELNAHEELMVEVLGTLAPDGYNLKEGGGNGRPCEEARKKMSEAQKGEKHHLYGKTGEAHHNYGRTIHTDDHKQKLSESFKGDNNPMFERTGDKHHMFGRTGENCPTYGRIHTNDAKQKMRENNPASKKVYQYTIDGAFVQSFVSSEEAARSLNKTRGGHISECANGKRKSAFGFKWSFTEL